MKNAISVNKYLLIGLIIVAIVGGYYSGYHYASQQYEDKEQSTLAQDEEIDKKNLICEARVQRGKTGDIKSQYFIFERSEKREDCKQFIEYKNIPDDTESVWMGF